jgi:hypothetical protein
LQLHPKRTNKSTLSLKPAASVLRLTERLDPVHLLNLQLGLQLLYLLLQSTHLGGRIGPATHVAGQKPALLVITGLYAIQCTERTLVVAVVAVVAAC